MSEKFSVSELTAEQIAFMSISQLSTAIGMWHKERNLVEGSTDKAQFTKLFEEFVEVYMALHPNTTPYDCVVDMKNQLDTMLDKGRIVTDKTGETLEDSIGDVNVVLINHALRNGLELRDCFAQAILDIKDRKGKMINGVFVKEEDL
ncbi:putative NTP-Ppase [Alteromonas phage vB_AspP-H4/4]|uniref:NTP-Ppase n=1 Tax=Alteromonas phage vB_AspP-H4/4 TaxID=2928692 RepID=A0A220YL54_9CAUD|nr:MazG-like pyrophosphatase [Alteromonas phage vB_AspP-H4/4]ASL24403.1 putative NTP-Ppase [Alteromonas phage vB_AspP-H4/4]